MIPGNTISRREARRRIERSEVAAKLLTAVGMQVRVWKDDGSQVTTSTTSMPWMLWHGAWVVSLEGFSGGYACERVSPAPVPREPSPNLRQLSEPPPCSPPPSRPQL